MFKHSVILSKQRVRRTVLIHQPIPFGKLAAFWSCFDDSFHCKYLIHSTNLGEHSKVTSIGPKFFSTMILLAIKSLSPLIKDFMYFVNQFLLAILCLKHFFLILPVKMNKLNHFPIILACKVTNFSSHLHFFEMSWH